LKCACSAWAVGLQVSARDVRSTLTQGERTAPSLARTARATATRLDVFQRLEHDHAVTADHLRHGKAGIGQQRARTARHDHAHRAGRAWQRNESSARTARRAIGCATKGNGAHRAGRARAHHHANLVVLCERDVLDGLIQHNVHELVVPTQDAREAAVAVQLHCRARGGAGVTRRAAGAQGMGGRVTWAHRRCYARAVRAVREAPRPLPASFLSIYLSWSAGRARARGVVSPACVRPACAEEARADALHGASGAHFFKSGPLPDMPGGAREDEPAARR